MNRYRKKPVVIEAVQYTGDNCIEVVRFMGGPSQNPELHDTDRPTIHTLEGTLSASPGDWIIKGVQGEFYPCKPDIFAATYEPATDAQPEKLIWKVVESEKPPTLRMGYSAIAVGPRPGTWMVRVVDDREGN